MAWLDVRQGVTRAATAVVLGLVATANAADWTQFRGPNASGISADDKPLPETFSATENVRWSATIGEGVASPVISQGRVFVTTMTNKETFAMLAFDADSGKELWRTELATGALPAITPPNTPASSTPATDGQRVYVHFSTLGLLCFDAADGKLLWKLPLEQPFYLMAWGAAMSPIVYGDLVYYCQDDDLQPFLVAVDKVSGKPRWRVERPEMLSGYAVPLLCEANGRTDLVVAGSGKMQGYDPATGTMRWTCNTLLRTIMSSPVVKDGVIYIAVQSHGDADRLLKFALLEWKDTNQDGKLAKSEIPEAFWEKFEKGDGDKDGHLVDQEIDDAFQNPDNRVGGGSHIQAIRGGGNGDVTKTHVLWNLENKAPSNISSPLVLDERIFVVKKGGLSSCYETADGKKIYELSRIRNLGNYYASPIAGDGKIFVTGENGFIVVLADTPELKILSKNDMGDTIIATPAIADGRLYVRTLQKLYCVGVE
jgi:outer membrane protein assembly factor BamB